MSGLKCLKTKTDVTVLILLEPFVVIISLGCEACSTTKKVIIFWENKKTKQDVNWVLLLRFLLLC